MEKSISRFQGGAIDSASAIVKISNRALVTERDLAKLIEAGCKEPRRDLAV